MKQNKLGSSDLLVSEVCLGTMTWGIQNTEEDAHAQLDYALSRGINFIDTAEVYPIPTTVPTHQPGLTELYIGRYLASHPGVREKLVLATKVCGFATSSPAAANRLPRERRPDVPPASRLDAESVVSACDASLQRLQTDYIDLYQVHWPDRYVPTWGQRVYDPSKERHAIPFKETLRGMKRLLDDGKIRAYGLSNETSYGVAEFVKAADELGMPRPVSIQNQFCLFNRAFETELAEACAPSHYKIALLPYSILAGGCLSGKYAGKLNEKGEAKDESLRDARMIKFKPYMGRFLTAEALAAAGKYQRIADEAGVSLSTLAQAFCKTRFFIPSSIIGATSLEQLKENIDAFETDLNKQVLTKIDEVYNENKDFVLKA